MNYGEIKHKIISLGFAEESDYEEYEELGYTYDAINNAIDAIADQFPYKAKYEFEIDDSDEGMMYLDMTDRAGFLDFAETPVMFEKNGTEIFTQFGDYKIEMGHTLVIDASASKGSFRVYYNKLCTHVDSNTADTFIPEIPLKAHRLIPYLASYFLWLDDDAPKAAQYYNMYETSLSEILQKDNEPVMRIATEWGGM